MMFFNSEDVRLAINSLSRFYYDLYLKNCLQDYSRDRLKILSFAYLVKFDYDESIAKKAVQSIFSI